MKEKSVTTLLTVPKTPEPRGLIFLSSEGFNMRAWTLVPFSPGPSGSKLCQLYKHFQAGNEKQEQLLLQV